MPAPRLACMEVRGGSHAADEAFAMPGLDLWVYSLPFDSAAAGGDIHYVSSCATGRIARVLVADVSGHGAEVLPVAADLRRLMARYVNHLDQRKFFRALNRRFAEMLEGGAFATAVVATYFAPTGTLSVSNAGHPPPLLWRAADRRWTVLTNPAASAGLRNMPLGVIDATRYDRFDLPLGPADLVFCYTDSLTESRDAGGELLSTEGLLRVAKRVNGSAPDAVVPAFIGALRALHPRNLTDDDVTLLAFRPNGGAARVPWRDRLAAPLRVARGVFNGTRPWPEASVANLGGAMFDPLSRRWGRRGG